MRVLNLGAGVQSTTLYLMFLRGELSPPIDVAIFADTQEEPAAVYAHLAWLESLHGPPILKPTAGRLGDDLQRGTNSSSQRFASIPAFGTNDGGATTGLMRRQCSKEYKTAVIAKTIRRDLLHMRPGQRVPKATRVTQFFGISMDEARRSRSIRERSPAWSDPVFPLIDKFMTRVDCVAWLRAYGVPHDTPKSACVFCPYHTDATWVELRDTDPAGWDRALAIDEALRTKHVVANRGLRQMLYLHRSCIPLRDVTLRPTERDKQLAMSFYQECEGVCGV